MKVIYMSDSMPEIENIKEITDEFLAMGATKMNKFKLENILLKFAIDVLDNANGKKNNTLGEMIDKPLNEILALADELNLDEEDNGITEEKVARAEAIRDSLREDGVVT